MAGWPFRYISECNNSEFQHEMHVSSFGYCSQLNFNSECQCIVLIIFLHEDFVAIEIEIEQNSLDGSFCSWFSTRFIKQNSGKSVLVHSISNWMTFNENQKRLLTSCFGNGLSLQFLSSSTIMNNIWKWLVMTMRLHALPLLMWVDFTCLRLHCPWWSLQPPLRSLFGLSDSSRPHGSRSALTKKWFKPFYFLLVEWNKSHSWHID
jgi:hypothetical protein